MENTENHFMCAQNATLCLATRFLLLLGDCGKWSTVDDDDDDDGERWS